MLSRGSLISEMIPNSMDSTKKRLAILFLIGATLLCYSRIRHHEFLNFDDKAFVVMNHFINQGINWTGVKWCFLSNHFFSGIDQVGYWAPIPNFSHMIDFHFFGSEPYGHHVTNLAIHLWNVLILIYLLKLITGKFWESFAVGAIFAVHPLNVESVAWIIERKGLLATLFILLSLCAYQRYLRGRQTKYYLLSLVLFQFSLMSKATVVFLPLLLLVMDFWFASRGGWIILVDKKRLTEKLPFIALSLLASIQLILYMHKSGSIQPVPLFYTVMNGFHSYGAYLLKFVYPVGLTVFYPHPGISLNLLTSFLSLLGMILVTYFAISKIRKDPYLFVGWSWYVISMLPTAGFLQAGTQAMADRYAYFPMIGISILSVWGGSGILNSIQSRPQSSKVTSSKTLAVIILLVVFTLFSIRTYDQTKYWRNSETLFLQNLEVVPDNDVAHLHLGLALRTRGQYEDAQVHLQKYVNDKPDSPLALYHLAINYYLKGDLVKALQMFQQLERTENIYPSLHFYLGNCYHELGTFPKAIEEYEKSIKLFPGLCEVYYNLAHIYYYEGFYDKAFSFYSRSVDCNPDLDSLINTAHAMEKTGQHDKANVLWASIRSMNPSTDQGYRGMKRKLDNNSELY